MDDSLLTADALFDLYEPLLDEWKNDISDPVPPPVLGFVVAGRKLHYGPVIGDFDSPLDFLEIVDARQVVPDLSILQAFFVIEARGKYGSDDDRDVILFYSASRTDLEGGTWMAISPFTRTIAMDKDGQTEATIVFTEPDDLNAPPILVEFADEIEDPVVARLREIVEGKGSKFPPASLN